MGFTHLIKQIKHAVIPRTSRSTDIYVVYPAPAVTTFAVTAAQVTAANSWTTWGTIDEIVASVTNDCWIDGVFVTTVGTVGSTIELQVGVGASGSETWLQTIEIKRSATAAADIDGFYPLPTPIYVPASGRIAQRSRGESAGTVDTVLLCREGLKN